MLVLKIAAGIVLAVVVLAVGCSVLVSEGLEEAAAPVADDPVYEDAAVAETGLDEIEEAAPPPSPAWDPPAGFETWEDGIAWRYVQDPDCDYGGCWQVEVVTRDGCPDGLYVALNILDGETVVGTTNDLIGSVAPDEVARLTLTTFEEGPRSGRLTEITCY